MQKLSHLIQNRMMRRMRSRILRLVKKNPNEWIYVVDTTKKPSRIKSLKHCGSWRESSHNAFFGLNLLVIVVVNIRSGQTLPLNFLPCEKAKEGAEKQSTAWQLVLKLLDQLVEEGFPKLPISQDSWFDGVEFAEELKLKGFIYETELKANRLVRDDLKSPKLSLEQSFLKEDKIAVLAATRCIENENIK